MKIPDAPFQYHKFIFNSDGTIQQSNPDAGDPDTSDSKISFLIKANGNAFSGTPSATFYDAAGRRLRGPLPATLEGKGVVP